MSIGSGQNEIKQTGTLGQVNTESLKFLPVLTLSKSTTAIEINQIHRLQYLVFKLYHHLYIPHFLVKSIPLL